MTVFELMWQLLAGSLHGIIIPFAMWVLLVGSGFTFLPLTVWAVGKLFRRAKKRWVRVLIVVAVIAFLWLFVHLWVALAIWFGAAYAVAVLVGRSVLELLLMLAVAALLPWILVCCSQIQRG